MERKKRKVNELLRRKKGDIGDERLKDEIKDVVKSWKKINERWKERIKLMEEMKDLNDNNEKLSGWLSEKERMMKDMGKIL